MLWELFQQSQIQRARNQAHRAEQRVEENHGLAERIRALESQVDRMLLVQTALLELLREHTAITKDLQLAKVEEVDLRDGKRDHHVTKQPMNCPQCLRRNHPLRVDCLYCGTALPVKDI